MSAPAANTSKAAAKAKEDKKDGVKMSTLGRFLHMSCLLYECLGFLVARFT